MRWIYSCLLYLILPFLFIRLLWKSRKLSDYRKRFPERLGFYPVKFEHCLWVHAASVGEALAAIPLIKALQRRFPDLPLLVTTMTPTGASRVKAALGDSVTHVYVSYDFPDAVSRFLSAMNPVVGVIMETELWPNLIAACNQRHIPVCVVNARLSEKSARGYQRVSSITKELLKNINIIAAQGEADAKRFIALGADAARVVVTGNLKFDLPLPDDVLQKGEQLREQLGEDRFIWIAASTHRGEEEKVLATHAALLKKYSNALLILVPRHPDRFDEVSALVSKNFTSIRRSTHKSSAIDTSVYIGDTMGEMLLFYAASDVAFVGGSFIPQGGHNILEVALLRKPIITGEHMFNFAEMTDLFKSQQAMLQVSDEQALANILIQLADDASQRKSLGDRAYALMQANGGALQKQVDVIADFISFRSR